MTREDREIKEYQSVFSDERYAKKAWKQLIGRSLEGAGAPLPVTTDKNGEVSFQSQLDQMAYDNVVRRLKNEGLVRGPMQAEIIIESQILRARFADAPMNMLLERTAGKVKDEINVQTNQFEELTDEELAALAELRKNKENTEK